MNKPKKAFTLIELLVVIAIIGILATISVLALSNARAKSRDAKRAGDVKQIQTALELFFNDNNRYPTAEEWSTGKIYSTSTGSTSTYMQAIPTAPTPFDGSCNSGQNMFSYAQTEDGNSYTLSFCLGNTTGTLVSGPKCLTPGGIIDVDCSANTSASTFLSLLNDSVYRYANSVEQASDGGYIMTGYNSVNDGDAFLIKTDSSGAVEWEKTFGGAGYQSGSYAKPTSDGGYIITGSSNVNDVDAYLVKTDANGNEVWSNIYGGAGYQMAYSVEQASDGGYIMAGYRGINSGDVYLAKTDSSGVMEWEKTFGDSVGQYIYSIKKTNDDNYVVGGATDDNNGNAYLIKFDISGNLIWEKSLGDSEYQFGYSVDPTADGGYIITGEDSIVDGNSLLIKADSSGNLLWQKSFGGPGYQYFNSVKKTSDGGYVAAGYTDTNGGDAYMVKTDGAGGLVWEKTFGDYRDQYVNSVAQASDGGYVAAGYSNSNGQTNLYLIKADGAGNISCTPNCSSKCAGSDGCFGFCTDNCSGGQECGGDLTCACQGNACGSNCAACTSTCSASTVCGDTCSYGGNNYRTVEISGRCWFKDNLNVGRQLCSMEASCTLKPDDNFDYNNIQKYCYQNNTANCGTYGGLYSWPEAVGLPNKCDSTSLVYTCNGTTCSTSDSDCNFPDPNSVSRQGVCPSGWHIPSLNEFDSLIGAAGGSNVAGISLKAASPAWNGNDSFGFTALPAGFHDGSGGSYGSLNSEAVFWISAPSNNIGIGRGFFGYTNGAGSWNSGRYYGYSLRCVKN